MSGQGGEEWASDVRRRILQLQPRECLSSETIGSIGDNVREGREERNALAVNYRGLIYQQTKFWLLR